LLLLLAMGKVCRIDEWVDPTAVSTVRHTCCTGECEILIYRCKLLAPGLWVSRALAFLCKLGSIGVYLKIKMGGIGRVDERVEVGLWDRLNLLLNWSRLYPGYWPYWPSLSSSSWSWLSGRVGSRCLTYRGCSLLNRGSWGKLLRIGSYFRVKSS